MTTYRSRAVLPAGFIAGLIVLVAAVSSPAFADQVVYFVNGKAMMVKSVEKGPKFSVLEVEGGGKIGIPNEQIDRIEEYQVQAAGAGIPQAIPVPPVVTQGLATAAVPVVPTPGAISGTPSSPPPSGPGYGGRVDSGPQGHFGGLNPIALGGDPSAQAPSRPQAGGANVMGGPGGNGGGRLMSPGGPGRAGFAQRAMAGRFAGRGGAPPRRGREMNGSEASPQAQPPPAQNAQPAATPPPPPAEESETTPEPPSVAAPPDDGAPSGDDESADQGSS